MLAEGKGLSSHTLSDLERWRTQQRFQSTGPNKKSSCFNRVQYSEGKERETVSEFIRYLHMAKGSAGEVLTQVIIAEEVGHLDREKSVELRQSVQQLSAMIGALIKTLKSRQM